MLPFLYPKQLLCHMRGRYVPQNLRYRCRQSAFWLVHSRDNHALSSRILNDGFVDTAPVQSGSESHSQRSGKAKKLSAGTQDKTSHRGAKVLQSYRLKSAAGDARFRVPRNGFGSQRPEQDLPFYRFEELLSSRFTPLHRRIKRIDDTLAEYGMQSKKHSLLTEYKSEIMKQPASTYAGSALSGKTALAWRQRSDVPSLSALKTAYEKGGVAALEDCLVSTFPLFVSLKSMSPEQLEIQTRLADLRRPGDWYPAARAITRELHLHVGPTNSGKTYHALQRLKQASSGTFAGPLRLLAHEVYDRFNKEGIPCNLLTGEEKRIDPVVQLTACTIEMLNVAREVDVLVIDEIQMIGDESRGSAWTNALLGSAAREIHMCGEASVVNLVEQIAETVGEKVIVHRYERLGGLQPLEESLEGALGTVQPGDAVVAFSRRDIFGIKKVIEQSTGQRCAVVYGALPPETRSQQAALFNDPDSGYDVMVASDAIGMGLNLSIKRVIFESLEKFDGTELVKLPIPQIKQIAGRAGRFKARKTTSEGDNLDPPKEIPGYVTTLRPGDLSFLHEALQTPTIQLTKASLRPPIEIIESFARPYGKDFKVSNIIRHFQALARTSDLFKVQELPEHLHALDALHSIKTLSLRERMNLCDCPTRWRLPACVDSFLELAMALGNGQTAEVLDLEKMDIDLLDEGVPDSQEGLLRVEVLHHQLIVYVWLQLRYPGNFPSLEEVTQLKSATEDVIAESLALIKARKRKGKQGSSSQFVNATMLFEQRKMAARENGRDAFRSRDPRRGSQTQKDFVSMKLHKARQEGAGSKQPAQA